MLKRYFSVSVILILLILSGASFAQMAEIGKPAPEFTLTDVNGKSHSLSDYKGKVVVLEWVNFGCPFVKKHYNSGNMQKLQTAYKKSGVIWLSICSSAPGKQGNLPPEEIKKKLKEYGANQTAYLIDASGKVGKAYGAKTTPHMFIINRKGILEYAGAIDNKPTTNIEDVKTASNYIARNLEFVLNGIPLKLKSTKPYGCSVKYAN